MQQQFGLGKAKLVKPGMVKASDLLHEGLPKEIVTQGKVFHRVDIPDPRKEENCLLSRAQVSLAAKAEMAMGIQAQRLNRGGSPATGQLDLLVAHLDCSFRKACSVWEDEIPLSWQSRVALTSAFCSSRLASRPSFCYQASRQEGREDEHLERHLRVAF